jgi:hypothetical protein
MTESRLSLQDCSDSLLYVVERLTDIDRSLPEILVPRMKRKGCGRDDEASTVHIILSLPNIIVPMLDSIGSMPDIIDRPLEIDRAPPDIFVPPSCRDDSPSREPEENPRGPRGRLHVPGSRGKHRVWRTMNRVPPSRHDVPESGDVVAGSRSSPCISQSTPPSRWRRALGVGLGAQRRWDTPRNPAQAQRRAGTHWEAPTAASTEPRPEGDPPRLRPVLQPWAAGAS